MANSSSIPSASNTTINSYPIHHHSMNTNMNHIPRSSSSSFSSTNHSNYIPPSHIGNSTSNNSIYQYPSQSPFPNIPQLPMQIQSSGICHQGVSTRDFVLRLCAMNPSVIPLVLVMKQFLQVSSSYFLYY